MIATMKDAQQRGPLKLRLRFRSAVSWQLLFMECRLDNVSHEAARVLDYAWFAQYAPCIGVESYLTEYRQLTMSNGAWVSQEILFK